MLWKQKWEELRPLQVETIKATFDTESDIILAAATASGKTEAAFLPILSLLAAQASESVGALYISPLKALINDQFGRLEQLCGLAEIPVHRWHGDVSATAKKKLLDQPRGVLLITPESLESQFINRGKFIPRLFGDLRFVVIDELHSFLDNVRGVHLLSLLARLQVAAKVNPRRFGLSATIGDFGPAKEFLSPERPQSVAILQDKGGGKELRISLRAFLESDEESGERSDMGLNAVAEDVAVRFRGEANLLFCNSRRHAEMLADRLRQIAADEHWLRDPFVLHHGSISKELREDAERDLKAGLPLTAICTSSLEMGIDIGSVRAVGQVGPTYQVSSLVQRLGRSGRKEGQPQILRLYTLDTRIDDNSSLTDRLFPELIRAIATVELMLEKWLEPPSGQRMHLSTCVHQILSLLRQSGGTHAARLYDVLCKRGAFRRISPASFGILLRSLAQHKLIGQMSQGRLILAPDGERIVESREFYAAFASQIEYRVEYNSQTIGVLPITSLPDVGEHLILAGRRWLVTGIEEYHRLILVIPSKTWKRPKFEGGGGELHTILVQKMREILAGETCYRYLAPGSLELLSMARKVFREQGLGKSAFLVGSGIIRWYPWVGTKTLRTLALLAKADEIKVEVDTFSLTYQDMTPARFGQHLATVFSDGISAQQLEVMVEDPVRDRFDDYIDAKLLRAAYVSEMIDLDSAKIAFRQWEGSLQGSER